MPKKKQKVSLLFRDCEENLSADFVVNVHDHLVKAFEGSEDPLSPPGLRDRGLLESAVFRQHVGFGDAKKYPSACANAASLMYGLCNDHPFFNGNKRTALICGIMHLDRNGLVLDGVNKDELFELMRKIASHAFSNKERPHKYEEIQPDPDNEVRAVELWLRDRARKITRGERVIKHRELWVILNRFPHFTVKKNENTVEVYAVKSGFLGIGTRLSKQYSYHNPGDGRDVSKSLIKELRDHLKLSERDGVDSVSFYDKQKGINDFIQEHRSVLRQLAQI